MRNQIIAVVLAIFLFGSCTNFDDINTNPDSTTQVSTSMLCTSVVLSMAKFSGADGKVFITESALSKYVGYANEGQMDAQYNRIGNGSFSAMTILSSIDKMVQQAAGGANADAYNGVAKFARAFLFYRLTMQLGDIPYSEAGKGENDVYKPAYDNQKDIFLGILSDLEEADKYFASGGTFTGDPTPYNGNTDKWRRACNAFALKVLMSLSNKADDPSLNVKARFKQVVDKAYLLQESTGFWGLNYSPTNTHPLYSTSDLFTGKTILSDLLVKNLKSLNDRRLYYYAEPAGAATTAGKAASDPNAYVGVDVSMDYTAMSADHSAGKYSLINYRYRKEQASEPRSLLTYAEQQLILSEAIIRGWINTGTAKETYEMGVRSALTAMMNVNSTYAHQMPIDQTYINGYFVGEAAFKATPEEQLKQIWMQRYILNFLVDGITTYFEYRRTGYPVFPINSATSLNTNNKNGIPLRWLYPISEANYNSKNLTEAVGRQYDGYDEINKVMWLLKN